MQPCTSARTVNKKACQAADSSTKAHALMLFAPRNPPLLGAGGSGTQTDDMKGNPLYREIPYPGKFLEENHR